MTDQEIITGFLEGKRKEYATVVGWIKDVVNARLWVDRVEPDDIISDTSIKVLSNLRGNKFKFESTLKTYVQRVTRYTIIDISRSYKRADEYVKTQSDNPVDDKNPLEILESKEEMAIFNRILNLIDEKCKQIWKMIFEEELPYKIIATKLAISEATVKIRVFRCKEEAIKIKKQIT